MTMNETPAASPDAPAMLSIALTPEEAANVVSQLPPLRTPADGYYDGGAGALFYAPNLAPAVAAADKTRYVSPVPVQIRADQARVELILRFKGGAIDAFIAGLSEPDKSIMAAVWEYRIAFTRSDPKFLQLLAGIGIGPDVAGIDAFYIAAAKH